MYALTKRRVPLAQTITLGTFLIAFFLGCNGTFAATPEREVNLTTYLRDGPSIRYRAVDEAETGTLVSVLGCTDGWCNVLDGGVTGYVAQSTLAVPNGQPAPLKNPSCFIGAEASYHGSRAVRYCNSANTVHGTAPAAHP